MIKKIESIKDIHQERANAILALQKGYEWFLKHFGHLQFFHEDLRGGETNPTIILATTDIVSAHNFTNDFESDENYLIFKKYLLSIGTANLGNKTYFYIQCNSDLKLNRNDSIFGFRTDTKLAEIMKNRCNRELFEHVDNYFR